MNDRCENGRLYSDAANETRPEELPASKITANSRCQSLVHAGHGLRQRRRDLRHGGRTQSSELQRDSSLEWNVRCILLVFIRKLELHGFNKTGRLQPGPLVRRKS